MAEVILRLSDETACTLWDLICMYGEHFAAGAPIARMREEDERRMTRILLSIDGQLGRVRLRGSHPPAPDETL